MTKPFLSLLWSLLLVALLPSPSTAQQGQAAAPRRLQVLFFGAPTANGPHHDPITRYRVLKKALGTAGIDLTYSEDPAAALRREFLAHFDAVLLYGNWAQQAPMPREQLVALLAYVDGGGGFVPVHCASACFGGSPQFVKLVGARFATHGGEEFSLENVLPEHPILRGLVGYRAWDETYVHDSHADDRTILQTRDGEPWSWTRQQGQGRVFYTASGHDHRVWDLPEFQALLRNAILWAVGDGPRAALAALQLPELQTETVSLPGYRERKEITVAQTPLSPRESMKFAQVPVGMRLQLFASEPDIVNPIFVSWDHRGRAFVIETIDYPNNLHRGDLGHDRITICEDTDGDGAADRFTRFAEGLSIPTSLAFANGGVICTNGPDMLFLADTDGDDRADVRKVLFTGFHMGDTHACVSNLRYGMDGWIYATIGYSGFQGEVGGKRHEFAQGLLRFRADGSALEFLQHTTNNTWGLGFTEEGDLVGSTANGNPSWFFTFPDALREAFGMQTAATPRADDNPLFFPMSQDIRQVDQFDRYTAAAGHALYTDRHFPREYRNRVAFVCEPTGKLVGQFVMHREGADFRAEQLPNNLYASADAWSAPVCAEVGPDGAVWICDWYNLIVQHNPTPSRASAGVDAKTGRGNAYETPLRDTRHGRVYRVVAEDAATAVRTLDPADADSLLAGLDSDNLTVRLHAQRLLVERGQRDVAPALTQRVAGGGAAAPQALDTLALLGALDAATLERALRSESPALRRRAIDRADPAQLRAEFVRDGHLVAAGRELAAVLVGLSRSALDPELAAALLQLAGKDQPLLFDDRTLRECWQLAARSQAGAVLAAAKAGGLLDTAPTEPVNLLPNADFGARNGNAVQDWTDLRIYSGARADTVKVSADERGRNDGSSLRVSTDRASDCGVAVTVPVQRSTRYRLSGWIRTEDLQPVRGSPGAMLNVHGGQRTRGVRGTSDWTEVAVEFDSGDQQEIVVHCLFGGYGGATGTAWFDDASLIALGSGATLQGALAELAAWRPTTETQVAAKAHTFAVDAAVHERGAAVYSRTCIACHGIDGRGVPTAFPPLDGSSWLTGDAELPIKIVLHGLFGPVTVDGAPFNNAMAPLGPTLTDAEIADVLTYVRQRWSNDAAPVDAAAVQRVRAATAGRSQLWTAAELGK